MVRRVLALLLVGLSAVASADNIDQWAKSWMAKRHIPGMAIGIYRHGQPVKVQGYGLADLENSVPVRPDSLFEVCSITKQFTATAVLLLMEDGKLDLDDPVSKHLSEWPTMWGKVTIRHLLNHTSGINDDLFSFVPGPLSDQLKALSATKAIGPGEQWEYSNFCYNVLGHLIQRVSGLDYFRFLQSRIFDKLGMKDTHPNNPERVIQRRVRGYTWAGTRFVSRPWLTDEVGFSAGGLISTVDDLNRWSEGLKNDTILKHSSRELMLTPGTIGSDAGWPEGMGAGYGFGVILAAQPGHRVEKHSGGWADASAQLTRFLDDDVTVVVLTNYGGWAERTWVGESLGSLVVPEISVPSWSVQVDPDPGRTAAFSKLLADIGAHKVPKDLVTSRIMEHFGSSISPVFLGRLRYVQEIPQGRSRVLIYRVETPEPSVVWGLWDESGKLAQLGSFPIVK